MKKMPKNYQLEFAKISVNRIDLAGDNEDSVFNEEHYAEIHDLGFTANGGIYIGFEVLFSDGLLTNGPDGVPVMRDYVLVARRIDPKTMMEASNGDEARNPACMAHRAFRNEKSEPYNWGADFINCIIAHNDGFLPQEWRDLAL